MITLVTGGLGFIGSALVRRLIEHTGGTVVVLDAETYAASPEAVAMCKPTGRYHLEKGDIRDAGRVRAVFEAWRPDRVVHLAAETHVDRSIDGPGAFIETNITGAYVLLQAARAHLDTLDTAARASFRFLHVSTDEVYGSLGPNDPAFSETTRYDPRSPYAASKAASDHLARAWGETFGLPVMISNCSNNYGPWQHPEKLIPHMIARAISGQSLPVYGDGSNVRDWLHVDDHARALHLILERGRAGDTFNIGGGAERTNLQVVHALCAALDARFPEAAPHSDLIAFVADRPGHDFRYAMDHSKLTAALGWTPVHDFEDALKGVLDWYLEHEDWWRRVLARSGGAQRRGLGAQTGPAASGEDAST
ncbi:dTDP-glucose 4,6-dehydratase [Alkalicaulis satelles]|uniref:dTDP-glucose 4,6-dehydratase n=1 Tax=Alkalicaulis satelles TaxID=2609175 RepID=A0A5M6ZH84_9PROT|nr:dTDP-glucose 4,6-dehydratase [Alkalicaulis satelles]